MTLLLCKFYFQYQAKDTDAGWAIQCTCYGIYTHNAVPASTMLGLYFSSKIGIFRLWLGDTVYMPRHSYAQYCPFQSHNPMYTKVFPLSLILISGMRWKIIQALVGRYSVPATAFIRTILSLPEPPLHILIPLFFNSYFSNKVEDTGSGGALQCTCHGICTRDTVPPRADPPLY